MSGRRGTVAVVAAVVAVLTAVFAIGAATVFYAAPRLGLSWSPERTVTLAPDAFAVEAARGAMADGVLRIDRAAGATAMLSAPADIEASALRFATARFPDGVPVENKLALMWRVQGQPGARMHVVAAVDGALTVDLVRADGWEGRITEVAVALAPADLLPHAAVPAARIDFAGITFDSDAYRPALAALMDEWWTYRPWNGRSINTAGFGIGYRDARPMVPWLLGILVLVALAAAVAMGATRRRVAVAVVLVLAGGWLVLDLVHLRRLAQRAVRVAALHEAAPGGLAAETRLAAAMIALRQRLDDDRARGVPVGRVAVFGGNAFLRSYPTFLLAAVDAGAPGVSAGTSLRRGDVVLSLGQVQGIESTASGVRVGDAAFSAETLLEQPGMRAWRLQARVEATP